MMETIIIHGAWWVFGFLCGFVMMGALALSSAISRTEEKPMFSPEADEPTPIVNAELTEARETAAFYQALYMDSMRSQM